MGQRILISEEEKKHIKKLYEAETAPPPDEYVVIEKEKNPFKYSEYEDARREYSSDLKDGDLFYFFNEYNYLHDLAYNMADKILNKTIRIGDKIYTTKTRPELFNNLFGRYRGSKEEYLGIDLKPENSSSHYDIIHLNVFINDYFIGEGTSNTSLELKEKYGPYVTKYVEYVQPLIKEYFDMKTKYVVNGIDLKDLNDEYFEIRKIQRRQTDF